MYRVQIEVAKRQAERVHLERESYPKTKGSGLFSSATSAVATIEKTFAQRGGRQGAGTKASREPTGHQWDMVCAVDRLPVESGASRLVWGMQPHAAFAFPRMAARGDFRAFDAGVCGLLWATTRDSMAMASH